MGQIDHLPPLRDVIERHQLRARRSLGQNFLLDLNLTLRIARAAGDLSDCHVIEVGPGPGGLTRALLAAGARHVTAIERDHRCIGALEEIAEAYPGRLTIIEADALETDMAGLAADGPVRVVANLPYNIATPLLLGWIQTDSWPPWWSSLTLMFQKEVADRIVAGPGSKTFGRLSVMTGWRCNPEILFDVAAAAFTPPPKVTSSIVHLTPKPNPEPCDMAVLERITGAAFGQRRKMLRAALRQLPGDSAQLISSAGLDPTHRAEQCSVNDFVKLAQCLALSDSSGKVDTNNKHQGADHDDDPTGSD